MVVIDYFFSSASTWSYVGCARLVELAHAYDATIAYHPVNLKLVFAANGGRFLQEKSAAQQHYREAEMRRWREVRGIPLILSPRHWPVNPRLADLLVVAVQLAGLEPTLISQAIMRAIWAEDRDISDPQTLIAIAQSLGMDGEGLLSQASAPASSARYRENTEEAIRRQMVGAPMYYLNEEPFWGQDRLELLERRLSR